MQDPELSIRPLQVIAFFVYTGTQTSVAIDRRSFRLALLRPIAQTVGASQTVTVKVTESDTSGGTYTDVPGASLTLTNAQVNNGSIVKPIRLAGRKKFLKVVATGSTSNQAYGVLIDFVDPAYGDDQDVPYEATTL
jgi:hypothetical protein